MAIQIFNRQEQRFLLTARRLGLYFCTLLTQMVLLLVLESGKPGLEVFITEGAFERPVLGVQDHVLL